MANRVTLTLTLREAQAMSLALESATASPREMPAVLRGLAKLDQAVKTTAPLRIMPVSKLSAAARRVWRERGKDFAITTTDHSQGAFRRALANIWKEVLAPLGPAERETALDELLKGYKTTLT